jgi:hypothetical protein
MIADGSIIARPAQEDKEAMRLLRLLSIVSRRRWPEAADKAPSIGVPPPKKKAPPVDTTAADVATAAVTDPPAEGGAAPAP